MSTLKYTQSSLCSAIAAPRLDRAAAAPYTGRAANFPGD